MVLGLIHAEDQSMASQTGLAGSIDRIVIAQRRLTGNRLGAISLALIAFAWLVILTIFTPLSIRIGDFDLTGDSLVFPAIGLLGLGGCVALLGTARAWHRRTAGWLPVVALVTASCSWLYWLWIGYQGLAAFLRVGI
jgi:hypothetical protein